VSRQRRRGLPIRRDTLLFVLGAAGIGYQQVTERYYVPLLVIYGLMAGVPGLAQLVIALRGLAQPDEDEPPSHSPTPSPSSPSPVPSSSSP
jgi:hypothetical protein